MCMCRWLTPQVLGMQAISNAGFMAAIDVTVVDGYPHLQPSEDELAEYQQHGTPVAQQVA